MKILFVILLTVFLTSLAYMILWETWIYPKEYNYPLRLADDSSLPQAKADYLRDYLEKVKTIEGEPRYVFMKPDLELDKQIVILEGLIQRFDDVAAIPPSEMAYQQGMEQVTGQEMNHQLGRISSIFQSARVRESFPFFFFIYCVWGILLIPLVLTGALAFEY